MTEINLETLLPFDYTVYKNNETQNPLQVVSPVRKRGYI